MAVRLPQKDERKWMEEKNRIGGGFV